MPEKFLKNDQNRDRAYVTLGPIKVELMSRCPTYQIPFKLKKFKFCPIKKDSIDKN